MSQLNDKFFRLNNSDPGHLEYQDDVMDLRSWKAALPFYHQLRSLHKSNPSVPNLDLMFKFAMGSLVMRI